MDNKSLNEFENSGGGSLRCQGPALNSLLCDHALTENMKLITRSSVRGRTWVKNHWSYYCDEHQKYGFYELLTVD